LRNSLENPLLTYLRMYASGWIFGVA
jgi:hypothetical protein